MSSRRTGRLLFLLTGEFNIKLSLSFSEASQVFRIQAVFVKPELGQLAPPGEDGHLEVDHCGEAFERTTRHAQRLVPVRKIKKSPVAPPSPPLLHRQTPAIEALRWKLSLQKVSMKV